MSEPVLNVVILLGMILIFLLYMFAASDDLKAKDFEKRKANLINRWNDYFKRHGKELSVNPKIHVFHDLVLEAQRHLDAFNKDGNHESEKFLKKFLITDRKYSKVIMAKHPPKYRMSVPLRETCIPPTKVPSSKEGREDYEVDIDNRLCSGERCKVRCEKYHKTDIRRVCDHQILVMRKKRVMPYLHDHAKLVADEYFRRDFYSMIETRSLDLLIGYDNDLDWVNVWFLDHNIDDKYRGAWSFSLIENRFRRRESPRKYANEVRKGLQDAFGLTHLI